MAFDGIARALLTGTAGYLEGQQMRGEDEERRAKEKAQADLEAAARKREANMDAMRASLLRSQIGAADALAKQRLTPDLPTPRNIDPLSPEGIKAAEERARRIAAATARYRQSRGLTLGQEMAAGDEEAQGVAIMRLYGTRGGNLTPEARQQFWHAWSYAKRSNPGMSNGRLAVMVLRGLQSADPTLRPARPSSESTTDQLERMALDESGPGYDGAPQAQVAPGLARPMPANESILNQRDNSDLDGDAPMSNEEIQQFRGLVSLSPDPRQALLDAGLTPEEVAQVLR